VKTKFKLSMAATFLTAAGIGFGAVSPALAISQEFQAALESEALEPRKAPLNLSAIAEDEKRKEDIRNGRQPGPRLATGKAAKNSQNSMKPQAKSTPEKVIRKLDETQDLMMLDSDLAAADIMLYEQVVIDTRAETKRLQNEITSLERQSRKDRQRAAALKKTADQLQQRLNQLQRLAMEAQKQATTAEKANEREERKTTNLKERLKASQERLATAKQRTIEANRKLLSARKLSAELERQIKRNDDQSERERRRQKEIQHRISQEKRPSQSFRPGPLS
jgi:chromosome segregation ATPase